MVQLFRHKKKATVNLEKVRLNPDYSKIGTSVRNDLEFYLPQLCSFYLNNALNEKEEKKILDFLAHACRYSFFFAHRVWFFFNSNINKENQSE